MCWGHLRAHAPQRTQLLTSLGLSVRTALAVKYWERPVNQLWAKLAL